MTNPFDGITMPDLRPMHMPTNATEAASQADQLKRMSEALAEAADAKSARGLVKRLAAEIAAFEKTLDKTSDVGMRLVSFGQVNVFRVTALRYVQPNLVVFEGLSDNGQHLRLVQHMSQLSFLLTRLPRPDPEAPRQPIGFHVE